MKISARYEVLGLLGQGGMGVVYHVRDTTRGRENALKTLAPGRSEDIVERFLTEAQVMFRLEHSNIVRVFDFGKDGETYFLTMELIRGKNLRQLLNARQNKGFPLSDVVRMGIETADALNYAHSQKPEAVVHRDIKPVNIMIEEETGRVVVTDFGIAKLMADAGDAQTSDLSRTVFAGTVPYSAPEQFQPVGATRRLDHRVDIYALGMVLYEIYTGRHFFAGLSADEVELHHRSLESGECPVKTPHACDHKVVLPDVPTEFINALQKAIARDRNERYKTAAEMLADLQQCAAVESVVACESARLAAESAGALDAAPTDFRRGGELEQEAHALRDQGEHGKAGELFRSAAQAFGAAAARAGERRAQRAAQQAKTAMQIVAREATDRDTAALAPDAMKQAAQLVAAAEASEAGGQFEQAAAQYRQAEEAFRQALVNARQAGARKAIEDELPALRAAREAAEQADAATLAADQFAAAVREQLALEEALAAGELTRVRELLPRVREHFESAEQEAARRLHQSVAEARAAMRAAAAEATAAGAPTLAKAAFIEGETLAGAAEKLAERGQLELAVAQFGRAADTYRTAVATARRTGERDVLAKELPGLQAARREAEEAGAAELASDAFAAATRDQAHLEEALAAGELTRVRDLIPKGGERFAAAKSNALAAQASRAAVDARLTMERARDAALAAGAEQHVPDALAKAHARAKDAAAAEERQQWDRAETIYGEAARAYEDVRAAAGRRAEEQRLAAALAEARAATDTARTRAKEAGAPDTAKALYQEAVTLQKQAAAATNDAAGMSAAAADYARATERFEAAIADAERARRRTELAATLATVEEARKQAMEAGAGRNPEFAAAAEELAAAERALAADELSLVASSAAAARERFESAKGAIERAKAEAAADAALAAMTAAEAEAREAGSAELAPATWTKAVETQKQALARRHAGENDAALAFATEAEQGFESALHEAAAGTRAKAEAAAAAARLAGPENDATAAAAKAFAGAKQREQDGKLVAAVAGFRKAADGFTKAVDARAAAARKAEADATTARGEAAAAETARLVADAHRAAAAKSDAAAQALAAGRYAEAEQAFDEAARGFRDAAKSAARERERAAGLAARKDAEAARERATKANAGELAPADLKKATEAFKNGEKALGEESFKAAEAEWRKAIEAFDRAGEQAARAALEREAKAARANVDRIRATREGGSTGFFARRKFAKADAVLARGTAAAASGDFAAATAAFTEAAALFEALPPGPTPTPPPAAKPIPKAAKPAPKPAAAPARGRGAAPAEATSLLEGATVVEGATAIERAPALEAATVVASAPAADAATVVASAPSVLPDATVVESPTAVQPATLHVPPPLPAPATRGLPVAWIGAAAAGVVLLAGVWWMMQSPTPPTPATEPKVVAKADVEPKPKDVPPPAVPRVEATVARAPQPTPLAKVEPPPPPPPPLPRIESVIPAGTRVEPTSESQAFRIALADPAGATYAWTVDGKGIDETSASATVKAEEKPRQVAVVAKTAGGEVKHEWELAALTPPKPDVVPPPVVSGFEPKDTSLEVAAGKSRRFSVKAKYTGTEPLRYAWAVDGKPAGTNAPTFDLTTRDDDEGETRRVSAEVSAGSAAPARTDWTVTIPRAPVSIERQSPTGGTVASDVGDATDFSVEAQAGRDGTSGLSYAWSVDKRRVADASGPRFTYRPDRAGGADVEVRVEAPDRQAAVRRWTVRAKEQVPVAAPTIVAAVPRATPVPPPRTTTGDARGEIQSWISAYRAAYEQKNVDKLVALGVISADKRTALQNALNDLDELQVSITSTSIDVQSPDTAVVSLTREDSFNAGGRRQSKPISVKKTLRRVNGSWVAQ